jgi:hypothetical protein
MDIFANLIYMGIFIWGFREVNEWLNIIHDKNFYVYDPTNWSFV